MAFQFKAREPVGEGVVRIVSEQIDGAVEELRAEERDRQVRIHQVRKHFKKIRAVLRLVRPVLGPAYRVENSWYRDQGRELSHVRDAEALVEAFERLRAGGRSEAEVAALAPLGEALRRRREAVAGAAVAALPRQMDAMAERLEAGRMRLAGWPTPPDTFDALAPGLCRTYRWGRRAFAAARLHPDDAHCHEWRKASKALWNQCRLFAPTWPAVFHGYVDTLDDLAEQLGYLHDLDVLHQTLLREPALYPLRRALPVLSWMIVRDRNTLFAATAAQGRRVYVEKPGVFTDRVAAYWEAWRSETTASALPW